MTDDAELAAYLAAIKVGDTVAVDTSDQWRASCHYEKVAKTTATQIVCKSGRYRRDGGRQVGRHYGNRIASPTHALEIADAMHYHKVVSDLRHGKYDLVQADIMKMRKLANEAEAILRGRGAWKDAVDA